MKKSLSLIKQEFESSCGRTPQYLEFHRTFKREFTALLKKLGAEEIEVRKPNHFDVYGFFRVRGQVWYFSIGDLRMFKETMLIRTAKSNEDYTGGANRYVKICEEFEEVLKRIVTA